MSSLQSLLRIYCHPVCPGMVIDQWMQFDWLFLKHKKMNRPQLFLRLDGGKLQKIRQASSSVSFKSLIDVLHVNRLYLFYNLVVFICVPLQGYMRRICPTLVQNIREQFLTVFSSDLRNVRHSPHTSASSQPQRRKWLVTCGLMLCTRHFYDWWNAQKTKITGHVGSLPGWRRRTLMSGFPSRSPSQRDTWTIRSSAFRSSGSTAEGDAHRTFHCGRRKWLLLLN